MGLIKKAITHHRPYIKPKNPLETNKKVHIAIKAIKKLMDRHPETKIHPIISNPYPTPNPTPNANLIPLLIPHKGGIPTWK